MHVAHMRLHAVCIQCTSGVHAVTAVDLQCYCDSQQVLTSCFHTCRRARAMAALLGRGGGVAAAEEEEGSASRRRRRW